MSIEGTNMPLYVFMDEDETMRKTLLDILRKYDQPIHNRKESATDSLDYLGIRSLSKRGNSLAIQLPRNVLKEWKLESGDKVHIYRDATRDYLIISRT